MNYEEMYLDLYICLWLGLALFAVLMVFLSLRNRNPRDARRANMLPLLSGIPDENESGSLKGLDEERNDTLSDT